VVDLVRPPRTASKSEILEDRTAPATFHWNNPAGGDWDLASNWQENAVPGLTDPTDAVQINIATTNPIRHQQSVTDTIGSPLQIGTSQAPGNFNSNGPVSLSGGTLVNANVASGTTLTVNSGNQPLQWQGRPRF
jgi:hypothetical protein